MHRIEQALTVLRPLLQRYVPYRLMRDVDDVLGVFGTSSSFGVNPGARGLASRLQQEARSESSKCYSALTALVYLAESLATTDEKSEIAWKYAVESIGYAGASDEDCDRLETLHT